MINIRYYSKFIDNYYSIKQYTGDYFKITYHKNLVKNSGFENEKNKQKGNNVNDEKLSNNISRSRAKVFEYSLCNDFDYFVTLTLDPKKYDRHNLPKFIKDLGQMIRNYRRDYGVNIQYLLIPERHQDGAWHMHGLMKGLPLSHLKINDNGYYEWEKYTKRFGYMSIGIIKDKLAVSKYITKYITKNIYNSNGVTERNKKLYYASRGLKTARKIKEGTLSEVLINSISWQYENEYIKSAEVTAEELEKILKVLK